MFTKPRQTRYSRRMAGQLMTIEEVSHRLRVTTATIRRWARDGKLKAIRLGGPWPEAKLLRFDSEEIERALRAWGEGGEE